MPIFQKKITIFFLWIPYILFTNSSEIYKKINTKSTSGQIYAMPPTVLRYPCSARQQPAAALLLLTCGGGTTSPVRRKQWRHACDVFVHALPLPLPLPRLDFIAVGPSQIGRQSTGAPSDQRPRIRMLRGSKTCGWPLANL